MDDLEELLRHAPERDRSIRVGVSFSVDWTLARLVAGKRPENPAWTSRLTRGDWPEQGVVDALWHAWYERPCRSRVKLGRPD